MLRIGTVAAEVQIALPHGATLTCLPATTALVYAARARADLLLAELVSAGEAVSKAGGRIVGGPDVEAADGRAGTRQSLFVLSLAEIATTGWSGIGDEDGKELAFDPALLAALLVQPAVAEAFQGQYLRPIYGAIDEGNV